MINHQNFDKVLVITYTLTIDRVNSLSCSHTTEPLGCVSPLNPQGSALSLFVSYLTGHS